MVVKDTWCLSPWYEMYLKPEGGIRSCCDNTKESEFDFNGSIEQSFNHKHYTEIRRDMLEGKQPPACSRCYAKETETGSSLRTRRITPRYSRFLGLDTTDIPAIQNRLTTDWPADNLKKLKIDFSNGCNLKCPMCSPHRSTAWFKDKIAMDQEFTYTNKHQQIRESLTPERQKYFSRSIPKEFIDTNWHYLKTLHVLEVSGGEPFYHPQFLYMLDRLVEDKWQGRLNIISNITLLDHELIDKLSKLKTSISISIDGMGDLYEYVRPAVKIGKYTWRDISSTIDELEAVKTPPDTTGIHFTFCYVPQLLNFYNIVPWLEWCADRGYIRILSNPIHNPSFLKICHLPDPQAKLELQNQLQDYIHINGVDSIVKGIDAPTSPEDWLAFCQYINFLDKQRKTDILKYIPEFERYWIYG